MNRGCALIIIASLLTCVLCVSSWAQSTAPIRLALLGTDGEARNVLDLLTVELSRSDNLALLERGEMERLYREQGISSGGQDYLKLGQVLGADGILLLKPMVEGTNQFMQVRLIAVQPGVIVAGIRTPWPVPDAHEWSQWLAHHFRPLFSKLTVPSGSAIRISVVNLRAAVRTEGAQETERQITLLATERLTRERELFVLERQRMDLLGAEKESSGMGDAAFWKGSFLLEGTIDRDGFVQETITLDARLVPPQGGNGTAFSIRGPRANLGELVDELTAKILAALQKPTGVSSWQAEAEAAKYLDEAKWALKWGMIPEAQAAAESAWALGKRDVECAVVRIRAYLPEVPPSNAGFRYGHLTTTARLMSQHVQELQSHPALARVVDVRAIGDTRVIKSLLITEAPDSEHLTRALRTLRFCADFLREQPDAEPKAGADLYRVGVEALAAASRVLQAFNWTPPPELEAREKLAELRQLARAVAQRIESSPSVRNSYWVGRRVVSHDELAHTMTAPNIFRCQLQWGALWQERPEDGLAVYRRLIESPVFSYIHDSLWLRDLANPRVIGWTSGDKARASSLWDSFLTELNRATNFLLRMEAKALEIADAKDEPALEAAGMALFEIIQTNRAAIVSHSVELPYMRWGLGTLWNQSGVVSPARNRLRDSPVLRDLDRMGEEWWAQSRQRQSATAAEDAFAKQKDYLRAQTPYDFRDFSMIFRPTSVRHSKPQAEELLPLLAGYKSNLLALAERTTGMEQQRARTGISRVNLEEQRLMRIVNPTTANQVAGERSLTNRPAQEIRNPVGPGQHPPASGVRAGRDFADARRGGPAEIETSVPLIGGTLVVNQFIAIPQQSLTNGRPSETIQELRVVNSRVIGDRLWFDLRHKNTYAYYFATGMGWANEDRAVGMFCSLAGAQWEQIPYPPAEGVPSNRWVIEQAEVAGDALYVSGWEYVRRYDFQARRWEKFPAPWQKPPQLFVVQDRLFGANNEALFEIRAAGQKVEILASVQRRPAVTALDSIENLRAPVFFAGPAGTVRVWAGGKIYSRREGDWIEAAPQTISEVWPGATETLLRGAVARNRGGIWRLDHGETNLVLVLNETSPQPSGHPQLYAPHRSLEPAGPQARWNEPGGTYFADAGLLADGADLYHYREYAVDPRDKRPAVPPAETPHAVITFMEDKTGRVVEVALNYDASQGPILGWQRNQSRFAPGEQDRRVRLILTSDYLILGKPTVAGVWLIPRSKLIAAIREAKSVGAQPSDKTAPSTATEIK